MINDELICTDIHGAVTLVNEKTSAPLIHLYVFTQDHLE